ncbi:hypothetical protein DH2020_018294 [Rehmannia glutinosa]|uniref:Tf2-1-like SH3-like domain-containing protein n=1 Tax=Rehmannia glutinosa TaxID=99300 RepID=A0ABR0WIW1_REHGL
MDFIVGLPRTTNGYDAIWVIIDRLTKSAHFLAVRITYSMEQLAQLYVKEVNSYQTTLKMAPYEALYGRKCRSPICWHEVGEKIETAQNRQKNYADVRRRPLEFEVGDSVFINVAPMKGVMRFGKKGKLSPRYVGPYVITKRIGKVAYELDLPGEMSAIHNVFHVSMLKKYVPDPSHVIPPQTVQIREDLSYEEKPMKIVDREVKKLRNKEIPLVKVIWRNHRVEEATWELEEDMRQKYPELF